MIHVDTREKIFQRYIYLSASIILVIISSTRTTRVICAKSIGDIHYLVEMEKRDEKKKKLWITLWFTFTRAILPWLIADFTTLRILYFSSSLLTITRIHPHL